jgi:hypothetical protein
MTASALDERDRRLIVGPMTTVLRAARFSAIRLPRIFLLAGLLGLGGCGGLDSHQTDFDEYTITADGDGGLYGAFETASLKACPQGFNRMSAIASPSGESRYSSWNIRCRTMIIHNAE